MPEQSLSIPRHGGLRAKSPVERAETQGEGNIKLFQLQQRIQRIPEITTLGEDAVAKADEFYINQDGIQEKGSKLGKGIRKITEHIPLRKLQEKSREYSTQAEHSEATDDGHIITTTEQLDFTREIGGTYRIHTTWKRSDAPESESVVEAKFDDDNQVTSLRLGWKLPQEGTLVPFIGEQTDAVSRFVEEYFYTPSFFNYQSPDFQDANYYQRGNSFYIELDVQQPRIELGHYLKVEDQFSPCSWFEQPIFSQKIAKNDAGSHKTAFWRGAQYEFVFSPQFHGLEKKKFIPSWVKPSLGWGGKEYPTPYASLESTKKVLPEDALVGFIETAFKLFA